MGQFRDRINRKLVDSGTIGNTLTHLFQQESTVLIT